MSEPTPVNPTVNGNDEPLEEGYVRIKLSHPLSKRDAETVRAKVKRDYAVNTHMVLPREEAARVIDAGFAQVDPADPAAVQAALGINSRGQVLTPEEAAEAAAKVAGVEPDGQDGEQTPAGGEQVAGDAGTPAKVDGSAGGPATGDQATETPEGETPDGTRSKSRAAGK